MICPYCEYTFGTPRKHNERFTSSYYCMKCREEYIIWESINPDDYVVECGKYRIYCDTKNNRAQIQKVYMDIESDTSIMWRWGTILELPSIPDNLTEETIEEKLKLYLLFS